jgi:Flp pilus assembly pilin Flp
MRAWCAAAWKRDQGQALVEYSLILALAAAGLVTVLLLFRASVGNSYQQVGDRVDRAGLPVGAPGGSTPGGATPGGAGRGSSGGGGVGGGAGYSDPGGRGKDGKGDRGCGGGPGGGLGRGGGGGCGGGRDR